MTSVTGRTPVTAEQGDKRHSLVLTAIVFFTLLIGLDSSIVNVALPKLQEPLGFSTTGLSWVLNAYTLAFGGLLLLGGRLGDILGRRRVYVAGILLFTLASLLAGLAQSDWWLVAARSGQGVGAALAAPSSMALIMTNFEGVARARAIAWFSAMMLAGGSLGLVVGGLVTEWISWRWVLLVNVPLGLISAFLAGRYIQQPPRQPGRFDIPGAATATLGMVALVYAFLSAPSRGWGDVVTLTSFALAVVLLAAFVAIETRAAQPIAPLYVLTSGGRVWLFTIMAFITAASFSVIFLLTQFNQEVLGFSPLAAGCAILPMTVAQFGFVKLVPQLMPKVGAMRLLVAGAIASTAGLLWLSMLSADSDFLSGELVPLALIGLGGGLVFPALNMTIMSGVAPTEAGATSGLLQTTQWLGGTLGLAIFVTVLGSVSGDSASGAQLADGVSAGFLAAMISASCGLLLAIGFTLSRRARKEPAAA
ncbi:MFS transporter [Micromonospora sp. DT233]|uniref:MFS transporter n=1 Tax=Micromonospora sp. DT233 TaxID=3393432 RepID=UPI003CF09EAA